VTATVHPSSILRARTDAERHEQMGGFVADLQGVAQVLRAQVPAQARPLSRAG
jgi:hypothetical protein